MAFVVTDGQLSALGQPITPYAYPVRRGARLGDRHTLTYGEMYRTQPALRMVVDFLARGVAAMACQTFKRTSDTDRERLSADESALASLLEYQANPTTTGYRLIHALISDRAIYDEAYWLKVRGEPGIPPGWLRRIPVPRILPVGGNWYEVDKWRIFGGKTFMDVDPSEIVTFAGYDPDDTRRGCSPIESLRRILAEDYAATKAREKLWERGNLVAGVISRPADAGDWKVEERERFEADWSDYLLDGPKAGGSPVLEDGMTWVPAGYSPKDSQSVEWRKLTREEVAAAYHIPPPLVGLLDDATFSNIEKQHVSLYVDTLGPWCLSTEAEINMQVVPDFYGKNRTVYVEFNINAKLRGDFEQQASQLQAAIGAPYMTPNEGRARVNLPSIDGGDELVKPLNVTSGDQANPQDSAPNPADQNPLNPNDPAPPKGAQHRRGMRKAAPDTEVAAVVSALKAYFERQRRSVVGKWMASKAVVEVHDIYDINRWNTELAGDLFALAAPLALIVGSSVAKSLTGDAAGYDPGQTTNYLTAQTAGAAESINIVTRNQVGEALTAHDVEAALAAVFAAAVAVRALSAGRAQATAVASWSTVEAGRQTLGPANARKQWVTGTHPREAHQALNGEVVDLDGHFSNGARWPGDAINLNIDDLAGCNCDVAIIPEGVKE